MKPLTAVITLLVGLAFAGGIFFQATGGGPDSDTVEIVHWSNSHLMRPGLLSDMAAQFNREEHTTDSGKRIVVKPYGRDSWKQAEDLFLRVSRGMPMEAQFPDPAIVSTSADHWLVSINERSKDETGRNLVNLQDSQSIVKTWVGIVTYRDMAECLGWPGKEIGIAEVIALRDDPRGWASYPCAKAEWGQKPLVGFTDPSSSSTGRSVLYSLYGIAAGKPMEQLTAADVQDPAVVAYVQKFQTLIDHYMPGTLPLNTKVYQGPRYGHFFLMPEDNLYHLYKGGEEVIDQITGLGTKAPPITRPMVMIYPREGSALHNHSATFVEAPWITPDHREGAEQWVAYLRSDKQQSAFMAEGFRPSTNLPLREPISGRYGLDPAKPTVALNPDRVDQAAAKAILLAWPEVKRSAIVTFVVDTSGSMQGEKLRLAKEGLVRVLDIMPRNNQVGLVTFSTSVKTSMPPATSLSESRFRLQEAVERETANGSTSLYEAVAAGIKLTDEAPGDATSIRAVVVLTDGLASGHAVTMDSLVAMTSRNEVPVTRFKGQENDYTVQLANGQSVDKKDVIGAGLKSPTKYPVQVFFIAIGKDADPDIGRILAQATGAEFQGVIEKDLARCLEEFSKYF